MGKNSSFWHFYYLHNYLQMRLENAIVKGVVPVLGKVEFMPVPGKLLGRNILDSPLLACLLIDNY